MLVVACASQGPDHAPLALTAPGALGLEDRATLPVAPRWWASWGDPQFSALMERALEGHPSLDLAHARVERAVALADVRRSGSTAQVNLALDIAEQRYSENGLMPHPIAGSIRSTGTVRTSLAWAPDLFGQQAFDLASALGQARAAQADAALAASGLTAQVGRTYIALARLLAQREIARRVLAQRMQAATLVRQRVGAGLDGQVELIQAEGALPEARGQIEAIAEQATLARRQLAVLSGQAPDALDALSPDLQTLVVEAVPPGIGTDLLGRRADVVAARWRVESAVQDVALARTQFYPNVNLGAFVGLNALGLSKLLRAGSFEYGLTPALRLPLFDGDRLRHQLGARQAELDAAIAQYNAVVFDAVREAGDTLATDRSLLRQQAEQVATTASAAHALDVARQRYDAGLGNYLAVLQAETPWLAQQRQSADLSARRLENRVLLLKALGGGWRDDTDAIRTSANASARPH